MLLQRILTALVLLPVTLLLLFFLPPTGFGLLTALMTLFCAWEWTNLMGLRIVLSRFLYLFLILFLLFDTLFIHILFIFVTAFIWWMTALILICRYPRGSAWLIKSTFWRGVAGIFVLVPCWVALNYIRNQADGIFALLFLFVIIWGADTAAYFVGRAFGRTKLAPLVSPGKSVEGAIGAILFVIIIAVVAQWLSQIPFPLWIWGVALALFTVIFSIIGDLFESLLKRIAGVKDSGQIFPGHGGLLDRIDSLTAAAPMFALGAMTLSWFLQ